jgi:hypothetical protein
MYSLKILEAGTSDGVEAAANRYLKGLASDTKLFSLHYDHPKDGSKHTVAVVTFTE